MELLSSTLFLGLEASLRRYPARRVESLHTNHENDGTGRKKRMGPCVFRKGLAVKEP
jgi:hypothetical protein